MGSNEMSTPSPKAFATTLTMRGTGGSAVTTDVSGVPGTIGMSGSIPPLPPVPPVVVEPVLAAGPLVLPDFEHARAHAAITKSPTHLVQFV
jgi:hypothetical protein